MESDSVCNHRSDHVGLSVICDWLIPTRLQQDVGRAQDETRDHAWNARMEFWDAVLETVQQKNDLKTRNRNRNRAKYTVSKLVHQQMVNAALLHPKFFVSFPRIQFSETIKLRIRGFFHERKNSGRTCHHEVKCRKALWL